MNSKKMIQFKKMLRRKMRVIMYKIKPTKIYLMKKRNKLMKYQRSYFNKKKKIVMKNQKIYFRIKVKINQRIYFNWKIKKVKKNLKSKTYFR